MPRTEAVKPTDQDLIDAIQSHRSLVRLAKRSGYQPNLEPRSFSELPCMVAVDADELRKIVGAARSIQSGLEPLHLRQFIEKVREAKIAISAWKIDSPAFQDEDEALATRRDDARDALGRFLNSLIAFSEDDALVDLPTGERGKPNDVITHHQLAAARLLRPEAGTRVIARDTQKPKSTVKSRRGRYPGGSARRAKK